LSWFDWSLVDRNAGFLRFVKMLIAFRKAHPILRRRTFFTGSGAGLPPEILWHGVEPAKPDFSYNSHSLAFALDGRRSDRPNFIDRDIYVAMNAYVNPLDFRIPAAPSGRPWRRFLDTTLPSPDDIVEEGSGPHVPVLERYRLEPHSTVILVSE
jgi:isoamylase